MPIDFVSDPMQGTSFERMQRVSQMTAQGEHNLLTIDITASPASETVRFVRTDVEGKPGVLMEERRTDGVWHESWSWAAQSIDAREGMVGFLNTQSHRWARFARMLRRRGPEELTAWIFELMIVPSTIDARPRRFEPQRWATIDQYHYPRASQHSRTAASQRARPMMDDCVCRSSGVQHSRDF